MSGWTSSRTLLNTLPIGRRGQLLAAGITLLLLFLLWLAVIDPLLGWYQDRDHQLAQRKMMLQHMQVVADNLPAMRGTTAHPTEGGPILLSGASDAVAAASLQEMVQRMAAASGATLSTVETLPAETEAHWHKIALRVSLNAPWPVLVGLLRSMSHAPTRVFVDDLHFRSQVALIHPVAMPIQAELVVYGFRADP